jgi:hypothetical protein
MEIESTGRPEAFRTSGGKAAGGVAEAILPARGSNNVRPIRFGRQAFVG